MAERQGFEPWIPCGILAFQASALDRYATSPFFRVCLKRLLDDKRIPPSLLFIRASAGPRQSGATAGLDRYATSP